MAIYQTTEYDTENLYDWTHVQFTIEDDVIIASRTLFDAGYEVFGTFADGVLTEEFYVNTLDSLGFDNRTIQYAPDGQMTYRGTVYPDAFRISENFSDGVRSGTMLQDGFFGDGTKHWSQIEFGHDLDGNIISRVTTYDNGDVVEDRFTQGVSQTRQDFSQNKAWETIDTTYDADGALATRKITYDNGVVREETFEDGVRATMVQTDSADAKNWDTITSIYDAGKISEKTVLLDNGDVNISVYADGQRTQLIQFDGAENNNWLVRVIDYNPEGGRSVTKYNAAEDIPADVLSYIPDLVPPVEKIAQVLDFDDGQRLNDGDTVLDDTFIVDVGIGKNDIQGILFAYEYGGENADADKEAFNSWGATVGFSKVDGDEFNFGSLSLANNSKADTTYSPEENWANKVTINGYNDDALVQSIEIDLTFEHVTHDLGWEGIDNIEFVASGGGITNDHVENAGWFSMDDLVFLT